LNLVIFVPFLRNLFRFGTLHPADLAICFGAGVACILWFEAVKYFSRPKVKPLTDGRT
jgi:Ca2+-transporting ATPase